MRASEVTQLLISYPDAPWGRVYLPAWMVDFYGEHVSKYTIYPWILWDLTNPNLVGMDTGWYQVPVRQSHTIDGWNWGNGSCFFPIIYSVLGTFQVVAWDFQIFLNHQQYWVSLGQLIDDLGKTCLRTTRWGIFGQTVGLMLEYVKFLNARWLQRFIELRYSFQHETPNTSLWCFVSLWIIHV